MQRQVEDHEARVADLLEEYLAAAREGRPPEREAFLAAHPDVRNELAKALQALERQRHPFRRFYLINQSGVPVGIEVYADGKLLLQKDLPAKRPASDRPAVHDPGQYPFAKLGARLSLAAEKLEVRETRSFKQTKTFDIEGVNEFAIRITPDGIRLQIWLFPW